MSSIGDSINLVYFKQTWKCDIYAVEMVKIYISHIQILNRRNCLQLTDSLILCRFGLIRVVVINSDLHMLNPYRLMVCKMYALLCVDIGITFISTSIALWTFAAFSLR